jgi:hypothetical protein
MYTKLKYVTLEKFEGERGGNHGSKLLRAQGFAEVDVDSPPRK